MIYSKITLLGVSLFNNNKNIYYNLFIFINVLYNIMVQYNYINNIIFRISIK